MFFFSVSPEQTQLNAYGDIARLDMVSDVAILEQRNHNGIHILQYFRRCSAGYLTTVNDGGPVFIVLAAHDLD